MSCSKTIRGIPVSFPFTPYDIQVQYMDKVIECLQEGKNAVLESPTGTGKTLSLLCASLAWLEAKKAQVQTIRNQMENVEESEKNTSFLAVPTIVYASRTHSQLSQAMQELKRTNYHHMRATAIGSRTQLCVNAEVCNEKANFHRIHLCHMKLRQRSCMYYNRVEKMRICEDINKTNIMDIEDLYILGQKHKFCPYYMAKELKHNADIIFAPYNYLIDAKARKAQGLDLGNSVIILDEGHNIEKVCEESASIQIRSTDITSCIDEVASVMKMLNGDVNFDQVPKGFTDELCILTECFLNFEQALDEIDIETSAPEGTYFEGDYIFQILEKSAISDGNQMQVINLIEKTVQFLATVNEGPNARKGAGLQHFSDLLKVVYAGLSPEFKGKIKEAYKVHIGYEDTKKRGDRAKGNRVLSYWCFCPGFGMNMLLAQGVHCIILTSGTLAPLPPLISELELKVDVRLENPHVVKADQIYVKILTKGPDNETLNCNYQNRDNPKYLTSLGRVVMNLIRCIPDGVLIFFPSYPIMLKCQQFWRETGLWEGINKMKPIFVEPRDKTSFNAAMEQYYKTINDCNSEGAIFMGVCRGKVSEGLDFADINARAVFIVGLPYPPMMDPKVILKKRYLDRCNSQDKKYLKGDEWYSLEATRAVNQAIGRVIRHRNDYGAIFLLDSRFIYPGIQKNMSLWLRHHIQVMQNFGVTVREIRSFFQVAQAKFPVNEAMKPLSVTNVILEKENFPRTSNFDSTNSAYSEKVLARSKPNENPSKKIVATSSSGPLDQTVNAFLVMAMSQLKPHVFSLFKQSMKDYKTSCDIGQLKDSLNRIFLPNPSARNLIFGLEFFIKEEHKDDYSEYCESMR